MWPNFFGSRLVQLPPVDPPRSIPRYGAKRTANHISGFAADAFSGPRGSTLASGSLKTEPDADSFLNHRRMIHEQGRVSAEHPEP
jgi:hypothetical protein